jgi:transposase
MPFHERRIPSDLALRAQFSLKFALAHVENQSMKRKRFAEANRIDLGFPNHSVSDSPCWLGRRPAWMGKPYSVDLRKRVVAAIEGGMSRNQAAKQFGVAISTAIGWMQRVKQTGSVAPGQMGGHKPKAISGEYAAWLSQRIRAGDFTLRGLVAELGRRGLKVDYRSVWEFVHAEKLSFKKKRGGWRTRSSRRGTSARPVDKVSRPRRT